MSEDESHDTVHTLPVPQSIAPGSTVDSSPETDRFDPSESTSPTKRIVPKWDPSESTGPTQRRAPEWDPSESTGPTLAPALEAPRFEDTQDVGTLALNEARPLAPSPSSGQTLATVATPSSPSSARAGGSGSSSAQTLQREEREDDADDGDPRLSHYRILGELGRGGMGVVYAAHDDRLDRDVAIKQLHARRASSQRRRLIREAQAMAKLSHPNVIPVYEIGELGDTAFIVMEYVRGHTLRGWMRDGPHPLAEILRVFKAAARGLIAAHAKELIHRDFKPDNVMIGDDGRVRVMDFGLARLDASELRDAGLPDAELPDAEDASTQRVASGSAFERMTHTGALLGTPAYMPLEQLDGAQVGPAADQFSFCVALYEALYGQRPFSATTLDELREVLAAKQTRPLPNKREVPGWLHALVMRGLEPDPEARFESMQILLDAIVEAELAAAAAGREAPGYVFMAYARADEREVLHLSQELLDHGVRPWFDQWDRSPDDADACARALAEAPALLVCLGDAAWDLDADPLAAALKARIERDPNTVYRVGLRGPSPSSPAPWFDPEAHAGVSLDAAERADAVLELAALIGVDATRDDWLEREAEHAGVEASTLSPYRGLEPFREADARWMFGREAEVGDLLRQLATGESRFSTLVGASGSGKSSLIRAGLCPALQNGALGDHEDWAIATLRPGTQPCRALAQALRELWPSEPPAPAPAPHVSTARPRVSFDDLRVDLLAHRESSHVGPHHTLSLSGSVPESKLPTERERSADSDLGAGERTQDPSPLQRSRVGGAKLEQTLERTRDLQPTNEDGALEVDALTRELLADHDGLATIVGQLRQRSQRALRVLLVVDQLEELFTEANLDADAMAFVHNLVEATTTYRGLWVVASLRADFVQRCLEVPALAGVLRGGTSFALPPMAEAQIRAAIERPAKRVGYSVEPRLVETLVSAAAGHVGRLPLLQHVLRELWQRRDVEGRALPYSVYAATGGLEGAIAAAAERALASARERLGEPAVLLTRRCMSRLVHLGSGTSGDTRRRASIDELGDDPDTRAVLEIFVSQARVLIASEEGGVERYEIAHEALLREWTTLVDWLAADRGALRLRQELAKDARAQRGRRDREFLWGRGRVEEARRVLAGSVVELNAGEREFLEASERAVRARARRIRGAVAGFMLAAASAVVVVLGKNAQIQAQSQAITTQSQELAAKNEDLALKERQQQDDSNAQRGLRAQMLIPENRESEALLLATTAVADYGPDFEREPPPEARAGLEQVLARDAMVIREATILEGHEHFVGRLAYGFGGRLATGGADDTARIWDTRTGRQLLRLDHGDAINALDYSLDGSRLATACEDGSATIWNADTGERVAALTGHEAPVQAIEFSPDDARVVTASNDGTARIWDASTGESLALLLGHEDEVTAITHSPDGSMLATASGDGTARLWDARSGARLHTLAATDHRVARIAFAPNGAQLATATSEGRTLLWDPQTGETQLTIEGHAEMPSAIAYSPDGGRLALSSYRDDVVRVWDTRNGDELLSLVGHEGGVRDIAFSPDGASLASAGKDMTARLWDVDTGQQLVTFSGHRRMIEALAFSHDGASLATASFDYHARIWPVADNPVAIEHGHRDFVESLEFSPDGAHILTASRDRSARIWDGQRGEQVRALAHADHVVAAAYSPDGTQIATATDGGVAKLWTTASGELRSTLEGHTKDIVDLAYSPDGARLATTSIDRTGRLWDAQTGQVIAVLEHEAIVMATTFAPDGSVLATVSQDKTARLWDGATGEAGAVLRGHERAITTLSFSPDGRQLATAGNEFEARIWSITDETPALVLRGHADSINALSYAPDGARLASASDDFTTKIWSAGTGELLLTLEGHEEPVRAVVYVGDGAQIATASEDRTIRIWDAKSGRALRTLRGHSAPVTGLVWSATNARLASVSEDSTAKIWDPTTGALILDLADRIGLRQPDASIAWPIPTATLARLGCARLETFASAREQAAELCDPLRGEP